MPIFEFRLEAQDDSGHFRSGTGEYESKEIAREFLEGREAKFVGFELNGELEKELLETYGVKSIGELPQAAPVAATEEEKQPFRELKVNHRAWLNLHRQGKPYKLVSLREVKVGHGDNN